MKKEILIKSIFITLIFIVIISTQYGIYAFEFDTNIYDPGDLYRSEAKSVFVIGEKVFGLLRNIATVVAILTIAVMGVKYIFASVEQKAEYKTTLVPWFIGAILVVMVTSFLGIIEDLAKRI